MGAGKAVAQSPSRPVAQSLSRSVVQSPEMSGRQQRVLGKCRKAIGVSNIFWNLLKHSCVLPVIIRQIMFKRKRFGEQNHEAWRARPPGASGPLPAGPAIGRLRGGGGRGAGSAPYPPSRLRATAIPLVEAHPESLTHLLSWPIHASTPLPQALRSTQTFINAPTTSSVGKRFLGMSKRNSSAP